MKIDTTEIEGLFIVTLEVISDARGYFMETFRRDSLVSSGIEFQVAQTSEAFNKKKGTIRGLHYQKDEAVEIKIVRCTRGKIFDVVCDIRPDSRTFKKWLSVELSEENKKAIIVPRGCVHGYQVLEDESLVQYFTDNFYDSMKAAGYRYDSPVFNIDWPLGELILSERDMALPYFEK